MIISDNTIIMATNPFFSGRIPQSLFDRIEEYRKQTKESKSEVLIRALAKYVGYQLEEKAPQIPPIREEFDKIYKRLENIESQLDKHREQLPKQLEITVDNNAITKKSNNNGEIVSNSSIKILSTKDTVDLIGKGCSSTSLHRWKRQNKLPKIKNGYQIEESGKGKWKITKIDN